MPAPDLRRLDLRVRVVARALARHGLVQAWGHCSARIDPQRFVVCTARPMGTLRCGEAGTVVEVAGPLRDGVLGEVRIHQQIYARRPDVGGVCRVMPPATVALSSLRIVPRPRHGVGAFVASCALWDDVRLLRDDALAAELACCMGDANAVVMRANGAVTSGASVELAMAYAWCLEDAARVEHAARTIARDGEQGLLAPDEVRARQVTSGRVFERLYEFMTDGDTEALPADEVFA